MTSSFDSAATYDSGSPHFSTYSGGTAGAVRWVELGDLVLSGAIDDFGAEWLVEELDGWDAGADVRSATVPRPRQDGIWIGDAWYGARMIEMKGAAFTGSLADAYAAKDRLVETINLLRSSARLKVYEDQVRQAEVRRVDRPLVRVVGTDVVFSVALLAPDPRKYAAEASSALVDEGGETVATNAGNVATKPTIAIAGPVETPSIAVGDDEITIDVAVDAGETLDVDFDMRTAAVDGVSVRAYLASGYRWGELASGDTTVAFSVASGGADGMVVRWRSAWI